eukprot:TRINITY_DN8333_c0_g1_i1.p1 TRINITY_DN8333_c0_g1~~TRINITY_DN8333_c0_g1_i1.p1  ORF type:complete len:321 (-),score=44.10 TRINITY_DN8333_c0_g1_i1:69-1031(-)
METMKRMNNSPEKLSTQVAGKSKFFTQDARLFKQCDPQEERFYNNLQERTLLKSICPAYFGVVELNNVEVGTPDRSIEMQQLEESIQKEKSGLHICLMRDDLSEEERDLMIMRLKELSKIRQKSGCKQSKLRYTRKFICMEDMCNGFQKPCVMDLKIGTRTHVDDAPPDKIERMKNKCRYTTSASLGFRFGGMQVWKNSGEISTKGKFWGRKLNLNTMWRAFSKFVNRDLQLVSNIIRQLENIKYILEQEDNYRLYSVSVLLVYDADNTRKNEVKLIDFAHAYLDDHHGRDSGALFGIGNIIQYFSEIKEECENNHVQSI